MSAAEVGTLRPTRFIEPTPFANRFPVSRSATSNSLVGGYFGRSHVVYATSMPKKGALSLHSRQYGCERREPLGAQPVGGFFLRLPP